MSSTDAVPQADASAASMQGTEPLACVSCRARKLKCDRTKPACTRCVKVKNECVYPESRRKPTFKRRNVKELEARLAQVEEYLKEVNRGNDDDAILLDEPDVSLGGDFSFPPDNVSQDANTSSSASDPNLSFDIPNFTGQEGSSFMNNQLMGLGMSEALPPFEMIEELHNVYFLTNYHFLPIIHSGRYYQSFYGPPTRKPPMCLQYSIWALSASGHAKYDQYAEAFYKRARQYMEADEMRSDGEHFVTVSHAQAWALIASYEAKTMLFTRASMSASRYVRLVQMLGLDRLDREGDDIPPTLGPISNWTELEERRRVFWGAFAIDAHASMATGWANMIKSEDVMTRLPASEESFMAGREEQTVFLEDVFTGAPFESFSGAIVICEVFKIILRHVHGAKPSDHPEDLMNGAHWKRHRDLDNKLSSLFMFLPEKFRLPQRAQDPAAVHANLNLHASVICLHHAAIETAEKYGFNESIKQNSLCRLRTAAEEIVNIIKMTSHHAAVFKTQLCALSLYCATTVYVYLAKDDPIAGVTPIDVSNLEVIINAMEAIGRVHQVTTAFLQQACLDIERNGLTSSLRLPSLSKYRDLFGGPASNIPRLARSSVSKHTEMSSPLPGRLPLGTPKGVRRPAGLRMSKPLASLTGVQPELHHTTDCFNAVLGAVTRNVAPKPHDSVGHKRKRVAVSPGPESGMMAKPGTSGTSASDFRFNISEGCANTPANQACGNLWPPGGVDMNPQAVDPIFVLPDRSNSSVSSPIQRGTGTEPFSGSSHTSPSLGLGNTPEENRIDLRQFRGRIATPIWQSTEEGLFNHITETIAQLSGDGNDPWALLNGEHNWNGGATTN
ncbi:binuclear zinc transcription factor [Trichoderma arundinaceum]|uniref:Binuclear zinc transcription factor n=1 Tax=Trichoderma arundinaceum TaxID=490622 RepID=A0A395NPZ3_TRIAR|nr:binuclear zinc transcription factor [Trichoderma arundinaceum]